MQCGFCTPGMLLRRTRTHRARGTATSEAAIQKSLAGHVCRCTGYVKIVNAVGAAVRGESFDLTMQRPGTPTTTLVDGGLGMKAVGARLPRYDGVAHVTGRTTFVDDVRVPGTLWAKALRSPVHHADITRLDTAKAEALRASARSSRGRTCHSCRTGTSPASASPEDEPLLAKEDVRYKGQPIALVAAADEETAMAAVDAIEVDFSEKGRRSSTSAWARRSRGARRSTTGGTGTRISRARWSVRQIRKGDIDWAFDQADVVVTGVYRLPAIEHCASRDTGLPGRARARRSADDLHLLPGALLLNGRRGRAPRGGRSASSSSSAGRSAAASAARWTRRRRRP